MVLDRSHLLSVVEGNQSVAGAAIAFLCARLRATSEQVEGIALHSIQVRLARFLLSAITLSRAPTAGTGLASVDIGTSQTELAQLLGASRQKVNVALAALEERGAVKRKSARHLDCSVRELERIAETTQG
jgi:CRP-like cAMP-binding protein